jgi:hypothetical protein
MMRTTFRALALALALVAAASGCRTLTGRTAGENIDNKMMVATVKAKLVGDHVQNLGWVNVDANDGVVYLTGNAQTAAQKQRATELAEKTRGVQRVVNNIVVNSEKTDTASAPAKPAAASSSRSSTTAAASPATSAAAAAPATVAGEVVKVDHGSGDVTLRTGSGSDMQLRLPPSSVRNVKPGDRLSVAVNAVAR